MKLSNLLKGNAILFVAAGIAFALYAPLMLGMFGILEEEGSAALYWYATSFARLYGTALFGFGFFIWAVQNMVDKKSVPPEINSRIALALLLANLITLVVTLTQQVSIWGTAAGWITSGTFLAFVISYLIILLRRQTE